MDLDLIPMVDRSGCPDGPDYTLLVRNSAVLDPGGARSSRATLIVGGTLALLISGGEGSPQRLCTARIVTRSGTRWVAPLATEPTGEEQVFRGPQ
jgi:hypothetical protein